MGGLSVLVFAPINYRTWYECTETRSCMGTHTRMRACTPPPYTQADRPPHARTHARTHARMHARTHACTPSHTHARTHAHKNTGSNNSYLHSMSCHRVEGATDLQRVGSIAVVKKRTLQKNISFKPLLTLNLQLQQDQYFGLATILVAVEGELLKRLDSCMEKYHSSCTISGANCVNCTMQYHPH